MEELLAASKLLVSALNRYNDACFAATKEYSWSNGVDDSSRSLVNLIAREMKAIPEYVTGLQKTRIILAQCRNSGRTISPINALPLEILGRIFEIVYNSMLCSLHDASWSTAQGQIQNPHATLPDALSHVCTRWRKVALGAPELWTHIDLTTSSEPLFVNLLARGQVFSQRAGSRPLDIHFAVAKKAPLEVGSFINRIRQCNQFLQRRIRRLKLETWAGLSGFNRLLETLMPVAGSGVFEELIIKTNYTRDNSYVYEIPASSSTRIIHPDSFLDSYLYALTRLTLQGAYLPWSSPIYTGLIDLRIFAGRDSLCREQFPIGYRQLAGILSGCPGLRILHFNLPIKDHIGWPSINPIPLNELEELNIREMTAGTNSGQHELFLSLLVPGSKPFSLSLSIAISGGYACLSEYMFSSAARRFFERSNITKLYVTAIEHQAGDWKSLSFSRMLAEISTSLVELSILGLDAFCDSVEDGKLFTTTRPPRVRIDTLILHRPCSSLGSIRAFVDLCSVKKLVVRGGYIEMKNEESIHDSLAEVVPFVKYSEYGPQQTCCPIDEWTSRGHLDW